MPHSPSNQTQNKAKSPATKDEGINRAAYRLAARNGLVIRRSGLLGVTELNNSTAGALDLSRLFRFHRHPCSSPSTPPTICPYKMLICSEFIGGSFCLPFPLDLVRAIIWTLFYFPGDKWQRTTISWTMSEGETTECELVTQFSIALRWMWEPFGAEQVGNNMTWCDAGKWFVKYKYRNVFQVDDSSLVLVFLHVCSIY